VSRHAEFKLERAAIQLEKFTRCMAMWREWRFLQADGKLRRNSGTRYGTGSGSDLALHEERDEAAPGRYRSLYRTA